MVWDLNWNIYYLKTNFKDVFFMANKGKDSQKGEQKDHKPKDKQTHRTKGQGQSSGKGSKAGGKPGTSGNRWFCLKKPFY